MEAEMKRNLLRAIFLSLLIATFAIIFNFSAQDGEESAEFLIGTELDKTIKEDRSQPTWNDQVALFDRIDS